MDVRGRGHDRGLGPAWTLVSIRLAFWIGSAIALLWAPLRSDFPVFGAYDARTDLLFGTFQHWDAGWYLRIAEHGYDVEQTTPFFPVFPLAVRGLGAVVGSNAVAGVLISLAGAAVAAVLVARIARPVVGAAAAGDAVLYLALCPVAFVFTAVFSEGLFLALAAGAFLAASRDRALLAGTLAAVAIDTRLAAVALVPPLLYLLRPRDRSRRELARPLPLLLMPVALGAYMLYLDDRFGSPLAFQRAQSAFWLRHTPTLGPLGGLWDAVAAGWHGSLELVRHLPSGQGAPLGFPPRDVFAAWNVVHLLVLAGALWLTWIAWTRLGPALGLYAVSMQIVLLSSTVEVFPLASYPRYLLADFPLFIALAAVTQGRPRARDATLIGFAALGAAAALGFSHHVWIA
jgi:hypothetical protein